MVPLLLFGCTPQCPFGPSCEDDFSDSALAIWLAPQSSEVSWQSGSWDSADRSLNIEGLGADWSLTAIGRLLLAGAPSANEVRLLSVEEEIDTVTSWSSDGGSFGADIAVGDLDQDGYWDLIVGAPDADLQTGAVYVFLDAERQPGRTADEADYVIRGRDASADRFGALVAFCPDLDGSGTPQIAIGAPWFGTVEVDEFGVEEKLLLGALYLTPTPTAQQATAPLAWHGDAQGDGFGHTVLCTEDFSGDGIFDLAVGAPFAGVEDSGEVHLLPGGTFVGTGEAIRTVPTYTEETITRVSRTGSYFGAWAGTALTSVGDLSGDGRPEIAIGAPGNQFGVGDVMVIPSVEMVRSPINPKYFLIETNDPLGPRPNHTGRTLASGDLDGDGLTDLVVGAPDYRLGSVRDGYDNGKVWIFLGDRRSDWIADDTDPITIQITGDAPFRRAGREILVHDLNGDGRDDLILQGRAAPPR